MDENGSLDQELVDDEADKPAEATDGETFYDAQEIITAQEQRHPAADYLSNDDSDTSRRT